MDFDLSPATAEIIQNALQQQIRLASGALNEFMAAGAKHRPQLPETPEHEIPGPAGEAARARLAAEATAEAAAKAAGVESTPPPPGPQPPPPRDPVARAVRAAIKADDITAQAAAKGTHTVPQKIDGGVTKLPVASGAKA